MKKLLYVLVAIVFILCYFKVPFLFFQQDEMMVFGLFIRDGAKVILTGLGSNRIMHFVPLTLSISYSIYEIFGMKYWVFNLVGLSFHLANGLLVYQISKRLFKKKISVVISVLVFFSSSVAAEFIMWPVININSIALTFSLFSWLVIMDKNILKSFQGFLRGILISFLFLMAVFSVEYSIGFALFIPAVILLKKEETLKEKIKLLFPFALIVFLYLLMRFAPVLSTRDSVGGLTSGISFPVRVFDLVAQYFSQLFLGQSLIFSVIAVLGKILKLPDLQLPYVEGDAFLFFARIFGVILILILTAIYLVIRKKNYHYANNFLSTILLILFSSLPFLLIPKESASVSSPLSSRYMYFGLAGMAICMAYVYDFLANYLSRRMHRVLLIAILFFILMGTYSNYRKSTDLYFQGRLRINILETIKKSYNTLPVKAIFYTESNTSYYGLPSGERILPFQSGFGQTLLIFYSQEKTLPKNFYPGDYLWEIKSQGYLDYEGRGFGYFRDFGLMAEAVKEKNIPLESVIAFRYDSIEGQVKDITTEVRGRLKGYLVKKDEMNINKMFLSASGNSQDINLAKDGNRSTFWDSKLPYVIPQSLEISFKNKIKVAQIQIDSYNNKDQNAVGYKVSVETNNGSWEEVFYAKRYPPDKDGIVNLYFEPKYTKRIKIEQVGYHKFASWVIHELRIYEKVN